MKNLVCGLVLLSLPFVAACSRGGGGGGGSGGSRVLKTILFETRSEIAVGANDVADAALGQLDGDRHLDLVVTALGGTVHVLLGQGNGQFVKGQVLQAPGTPIDVHLVDLDNDGDSDLVVLRPEASRISVFLNDGNANFAVAGAVTTASRSTSLVVGDCDGDSVPDLVVAASTSVQIALFSGNGDGSFRQSVSLQTPAGTEPFGMALGDVTGDGINDLLVTDTANASLVVFPAKLGGGHLAPKAFKAGKTPLAVAVGDLNGDQRNDIVISNFGDRTFTLLKNQGAGKFVASTLTSDGAPAHALIGDVTGDGINDLVAAVFERASISIFAGLGDGTLDAEIQMDSSGLPFRPLIGDVNEDNEPDLLVTGSGLDKVSLYLGRGGLLSGSVDYETGIDTPQFVVAADLDGDNQAEMVVAGNGSSKVAILGLFEDKRMNTRVVRPVKVIDIGRPVFNIARGDFNGDGKVDIAVATDKGLKVLANGSVVGSLAFSVLPPDPGKVLAPGVGPFEVAAADMNQDGLTDLVATDVFENKVQVLLATGEFRYRTTPFSVPVADVPGGLAVADFTGDGIPDVAVSRNSAAKITILKNDGRGMLSPLLDIPTGPLPNFLRSADFDRDGRADLVVSTAGADSITVLLARGKSFVPLILPAGKAPTALLTRDLNRDGTPDILVASLSGADFRVLLGDGRGGFPTQLPFPGTFKASSADLSDLNGNSLEDLVIASLETTRLSVYRNISK